MPARTTPATKKVASGQMAASRARDALRRARLRAGLTQEQAEGEGRSYSTISRWETGATEPSWSALDKYAKDLGQPIILTFGPKSELEEPPTWAALLDAKVDALLIEAGFTPDRLAALGQQAARQLMNPGGGQRRPRRRRRGGREADGQDPPSRTVEERE